MKRVLKTLMATALCVSAIGIGTASAADWKIDGAHSSVSFSVSHMVISETTGKFTEFTGSASFDTASLSGATAEMIIQVASLTTANENRDEHLLSADFFESEKFPTISFKTTSVSVADKGSLKVTGAMTMKGVTKEISFTGKFRGVVSDPWGNTRAGITISSTIDRTDFALTWSKPMDGGGLVVGHDVDLTLRLELVQAKPEESEESTDKK